MKVRLNGDSLRVRLGPAEVDRLARSGSVSGRTRLTPAATLTYTLAAEGEAVSVTFDDGHHLRVALPPADVAAWAGSADRVDLHGVVSVGHGRHLSVLIEKDFECLHGQDREADVFPNPAAPLPGTPGEGRSEGDADRRTVLG